MNLCNGDKQHLMGNFLLGTMLFVTKKVEKNCYSPVKPWQNPKHDYIEVFKVKTEDRGVKHAFMVLWTVCREVLLISFSLNRGSY